MPKLKQSDLDPADFEQCQAEKPNGANAFTLGGRPGLIRCTNAPSFILKETKPGKDGLMGSMSLCDKCLTIFLEQQPEMVKRTKTTPIAEAKGENQ